MKQDINRRDGRAGKPPGSIVVRRRGRTFVINTSNPRWKGRQG